MLSPKIYVINLLFKKARKMEVINLTIEALQEICF
jgi:hypothetical protein